MTIDSSSTTRRAGLTLAVIGSLLGAAPSHAEAYEAQLRYGEAGADYRAAGIALRLPSWWSANPGGWKATLSPGLEFTQFRYDGRQGDERLNAGGALGFFRIERASGALRPYAEAGIGVAAFSRKDLGNKDFSTHFQFTEQLNLGLRFAERWSLAVGYAHYSNADLKTPNDGIDMYQAVLGIAF